MQYIKFRKDIFSKTGISISLTPHGIKVKLGEALGTNQIHGVTGPGPSTWGQRLFPTKYNGGRRLFQTNFSQNLAK